VWIISVDVCSGLNQSIDESAMAVGHGRLQCADIILTWWCIYIGADAKKIFDNWCCCVGAADVHVTQNRSKGISLEKLASSGKK
jgi:hypothetical protein